jgi:uncharacterized protein (TIGR02246 family)
MKLKKLIAIAALLVTATLAIADDDPYAEDRQQLRAILADSERAINEQNIDQFASYIEESARVTWLDGEVSVGPEGVKSYFKRMVGKSPDTTLSKYITHAQVTGHARFYGDVAIANGTMEDEFTPHQRSPFKLHSNWTVAFVKKDDSWKIISLNFSTNVFNNPLMDELRQQKKPDSKPNCNSKK